MTRRRYNHSVLGLCLALSLVPATRNAAGAAPVEFQTMTIPFELAEGVPVRSVTLRRGGDLIHVSLPVRALL